MDVPAHAAGLALVVPDVGRVALHIPLVRADVLVVIVNVAAVAFDVPAIILDVGAFFCGIGFVAIFAVFAHFLFVFADVALVLVDVGNVLVAVAAVLPDIPTIGLAIALVMADVLTLLMKRFFILLHVAGGCSRGAGARGLRNCTACANYAGQNDCGQFPGIMSHRLFSSGIVACTRVEPVCKEKLRRPSERLLTRLLLDMDHDEERSWLLS